MEILGLMARFSDDQPEARPGRRRPTRLVRDSDCSFLLATLSAEVAQNGAFWTKSLPSRKGAAYPAAPSGAQSFATVY
jgi:hypothetical protein